MTREEAIKKLVDYDESAALEYLENIFRNGIKGYENFSGQELREKFFEKFDIDPFEEAENDNKT